MAVSIKWVSFVAAILIIALVFGVRIRAPDLWKLPHRGASMATKTYVFLLAYQKH